jgi:hypothetical protein
MCDPTRLHSRLRKCVSQHTGDKVDGIECRQRFNMQDLELEVADCSATCANSAISSQPQQIQSDAPLVMVPSSEPTFMLSTPFSRLLKANQQQPSAQRIGAFDPMEQNAGGISGSNGMDMYVNNGDATDRQQPIMQPDELADVVSPSTQSNAPMMPSLIQLDSQQQQMSCSNCTSDEICLLLITQKVPFCAKIKDRLDESGCGGWCKAQDQLCQPAGQNAFKCTHNSECLPDEWRCHDSACIPASKRCDGHENCFDSSDERYCNASSPSSHLTANYRQQ